MKTVFADTSYFIAMVSSDDENHIRATALSRERFFLVTTQWVLSELAAYLSAPGDRQLFLDTLTALERSAAVDIVPASSEGFQMGIRLYAERADKYWSLTDCISFLVMRERGLRDALTADHHFEQAGFVAMLR